MYTAFPDRYNDMLYNRCGKSGLKLPAISLGLWQNFGSSSELAGIKQILLAAFDKGITHFDLANNYGPPGGEAELNFGKVLKDDLHAYRDELIIATKAGYYMWPGPYGEWGSRKYLTASINQSLKRLGVDYVDIFYSHRPDPETPLEETMGALDAIVRSGKALYAGISNYDATQTKQAADILRSFGTPCIIHQPKYSMLDRWVEEKTTSSNKSLLDVVDEENMGCIVFSPLAQGRLSDKYLNGVPLNSRIARNLGNGAIDTTAINDELLGKIKGLQEMALQRNQSLAQMAIAWLLKDKRVTSVLVGASSVQQMHNSVDALRNTIFSAEELVLIEKILKG
ncbi:MAG: L-glyceraldehyde 3-phosphate reductase [Sphingobacteriales bacterium]|nr:MAG: L-glyceraldehyde 3-phosphate reductase [Sphingobacteriales bacterium]